MSILPPLSSPAAPPGRTAGLALGLAGVAVLAFLSGCVFPVQAAADDLTSVGITLSNGSPTPSRVVVALSPEGGSEVVHEVVLAPLSEAAFSMPVQHGGPIVLRVTADGQESGRLLHGPCLRSPWVSVVVQPFPDYPAITQIDLQSNCAVDP